MRRHIAPILLVTAGLAAAFPGRVQAEDPSAADRDRLQGGWDAVSSVDSERPDVHPTHEPRPVPGLAFDGEKLLFDGYQAGTFTVDAARAPKAMDWRLRFPLHQQVVPERWIYKIEGDTLTICGALEGRPRPTDFAIPQGSHRRLDVYRRHRPAARPPVAAAPAKPKESPAADLVTSSVADRERLKGGWYVVSSVDSEADPNAAATRDAAPEPRPALAFDGDRLRLSGESFGAFTIDAARRPKVMDWQVVPEARNGGLNRGIYKIEGDTLTICIATPGHPRPRDFTAPRGSHRYLEVFSREPPP